MLNLVHVARGSRWLRRAVVGAAACVAFATVMLGASVEAHALCDEFIYPVDCGNDICCQDVCGGSCNGPGTQCCGGCFNPDYPHMCGDDNCCGNTLEGPQGCCDGECCGPDTGGTGASTGSGTGTGSGAGTGSGGASSGDGGGGGSDDDGSGGGCSAGGQTPGAAGLSLLGLAALLFTRRRSPRAS